MEHYWTALDKALGSFHRLKIEEINRIIKELWSVTYMGEDIDTIEIVSGRVEINQCVGCTRQYFTKSFLGDDAAVLTPSSGEELASPRHRAGGASMAWRSTRRFSTNAP